MGQRCVVGHIGRNQDVQSIRFSLGEGSRKRWNGHGMVREREKREDALRKELGGYHAGPLEYQKPRRHETRHQPESHDEYAR